MEITMQQMVEVHTEMMRVLTQNMFNRDSKELPPGVQQVLDDHLQIVQMMSQIVASTNNSLPQNDHGGKTTSDDVEMTLQACKRYGEIRYTSKECHEQCPYYVTSHPVGECPMTQVTCFLCEGINQQAKDGMRQLLGKTREDGRPKMKVEDKILGTTHNPTTKCCFSCEKEGYLSRDCLKKKKRCPTMVVEYEENEVRDLLALERPQKKKDNSKVMCFNCKELGHYASKCPEKDNKANGPGSVKKNLNHITCYTCKQQGHYSYQCTEESTSRPQ
jgi:hypothetical protein